MIDVLFITRPSIPEDMGKEMYRDIRLHIQKKAANISLLRNLARSEKGSYQNSMSENAVDSSEFFVLTPIYIKEFLKKRGITMVEVSSADDMERIKDYGRGWHCFWVPWEEPQNLDTGGKQSYPTGDSGIKGSA